MPRSSASASAPGPVDTVDSDSHGRFMLIANAIALLALCVVTFAHPSASRMHSWPWSAVVMALWLFPIAALMVGMERRYVWRIPRPLILSGLVLLALGAYASAVVSPFAGASLPRIWPTLGGVALYVWLHHVWSSPDETSVRRRAHGALLLGACGAGLAVASFARWAGGAWPLPWLDRNTVPFGHSTYVAGAIVLFLPWIVLQARTGRGAVRSLWALAAVIALIALVGTSSRGGVLALAFTGAVIGVAAVLMGSWSRQRKLLLLLGLAAVGVTTILANPRLRELVLQRRWGETARESNVQRQAMLQAGLFLGSDRPLLGWGPGTVPLAYPRIRAELEGGVENVLQLHNTPVQLWATLGIPGAGALLLLLAGTVQTLRRLPRTPIALAAGASLLGFGLMALTDHQLDLPFLTAGAAASFALLTPSESAGAREVAPPATLRRLLLVPMFASVLFATRGSLGDIKARRLYDAALTALEAGRTDGAISLLDQAAKAAPWDPFFQHHAAALLLEQHGAVRDASAQRTRAADAAARLEKSLATGAHQEFAHFALGWLYLDLERPADAARHFAAAARLVPDKGGVYFGLGLAHRALGNASATVRSFALEIINDPRHLTSPAWEVPVLANVLPAVRAEARRLYLELQNEHPRASVIGAWTRWWWGDTVTVDELRPGFNIASARFVEALPAIQRRAPLSFQDTRWSQAYAAWHASREAGASVSVNAFVACSSGDVAFAAALLRRAQRYPDDFGTFLRAPSGDEPAFVRLFRRQRSGYGVLALHPEGPLLHDLYLVQENRVATDLGAGLFPPKGWLPGRFLLALLPPDPR